MDAIMYDDGWMYNDSWELGTFRTEAKNVKKAYTRFLRKNGITFKKNRTIIEEDSYGMEILDRKTKAPLFCAVYKGE